MILALSPSSPLAGLTSIRKLFLLYSQKRNSNIPSSFGSTKVLIIFVFQLFKEKLSGLSISTRIDEVELGKLRKRKEKGSWLTYTAKIQDLSFLKLIISLS